jgi:hypothetical protein
MESIELFCLTCGEDVEHEFLSAEYLYNSDIQRIKKEDEDYDAGGQLTIKDKSEIITVEFKCQIVQCNDCKALSMRKVKYHVGSDYSEPLELIPLRRNKAPILNKPKKIPTNVYDLYCEAIKAFNNTLWFSAGASIRVCVEIICHEQGLYQSEFDKKIPAYIAKKYCQLNNKKNDKLLVRDKKAIEELLKLPLTEDDSQTLSTMVKLRDLVNKLISQKLSQGFPDGYFKTLNKVVEWGNATLHKFRQPEEEELRNVFTILEFVFDTLYFKKRQNYEASKQAFESQFTGNRNRLKALETDES